MSIVPARTLDLGLRQRVRQRLTLLGATLGDRFRLAGWFPHAPLAIGLAVLGWLELRPVLEPLMRAEREAHGLEAYVNILLSLAIGDLTPGIIGMVLLVMSLGVAFRSRLAWTVAVTLTLASMALHWDELLHHAPLALLSGTLLVLLLVFRNHFDRSSLAAGTLFGVVSILLLLAYGVFGSLVLGTGFAPTVSRLDEALYFAVVTMSTVGYGDIVPKTVEARLFTVSMIVLGITVFATSFSAILVPIVNRRLQHLVKGERKHMERKNHYVIAGDTPLARNALREFRARGLPVTMILDRETTSPEYADVDTVVGDASDLQVLTSSGAADALAVLALGADDSENAFTVLAVKELRAETKTVAAVHDSRNIRRVRAVKPDLVIAPQVLGGEILAMALTGEQVESETLFNRLFNNY